jgi:hypothetical protein
MSRHLVLASALLVAAGRALPAQTPQQEGYQQVFDELKAEAPRGDQVATVHHLLLQRDVMTFRLEDGKLYLLTPVNGQTAGAVFVGTGSMAFAPPFPVERGELQHDLGDSVLDTPLSSAVMFFTDSTLAELHHHLTFGTASVDHDAPGAVGSTLSRMIDAGTHYADATLMTGLLNGDANGYFYARIDRPHGEELMYEVDPTAPEGVQLYKRGRLGDKLQVVCQFPRSEELADTLKLLDAHDALTITHYNIDATFSSGLDFSALVSVRFTAQREGARWAKFYLFRDMNVDSILDGDGSRDSLFRPKSTFALWVRFSHPLHAGQTDSLRFAYHGTLLAFGSMIQQFAPDFTSPWSREAPPAMDTWFYIKSTGNWFPRYGNEDASDVSLTFHTPTKYQFASIGRLVDSTVVGDVRTTHWVTELPTDQVSFNIGAFKEFQVTDPRIPPVTVQVNAVAHERLNLLLPQPKDPEQMVGTDVVNSLSFFSRVYGKPLFSHYYATEIPYFHGQAFPGLIHLSWVTYQSSDESGAEEIFRAHEMAHQWWGIGVEPAGYRDTWLSEGFADFSGLWYMQMIIKDNQKFFHQLDEWKKAIRARRGDAPPIGFGTRVGDALHPEDYQTIIYSKGAWVLQMIRNLMLDLRTMSEDAFTATMQDFYTQYRGKRASTRDFQRVVEKHMGSSMGWFFDEWINGRDMPTYTLSWKAEPTPDHAYILHLRVRQEDVPNNFMMPVPLLIQFADNSHALVRVNVRGPVTEGQLKVPAEPTQLELNPLASVLADVKTEGWR